MKQKYLFFIFFILFSLVYLNFVVIFEGIGNIDLISGVFIVNANSVVEPVNSVVTTNEIFVKEGRSDDNYDSGPKNLDKIDEELLEEIENTLPNEENIQRILIQMEEGKSFTKSNFDSQVKSSKKTSRIQSSKSKYLKQVKEMTVIEYDLSNPDILIELANNPDVREVMIEPILYLSRSEAVQIINSDVVNAMQVNGTNLTGKDYSICSIDSGIDYTHPELSSFIINGRDTRDNDNDSMDTYSHGTKVAGVFHATAPEANIIAVRACHSTCNTIDVRDAIQWCIDNKDTYNISTISLSLGDGISHPGISPCPTLYGTALRDAKDAGMFIAAASGNDAYTNGIQFPACSPYAISVGASDDIDNVWSNSNRGSNLELLAPGVDITTTQYAGGYTTSSGTSYAAPFVAAAATLLYQNYDLNGFIGYNMYDIRDLLVQSGDPINDSAGTGLIFPRLNVEAAINGIGCYKDSNCGASVYGPAYCMSGDVYQNVSGNVCNNAGKYGSTCGVTSEVPTLTEACGFGCNAGACLPNPDVDGDGYNYTIDCDDNNASINPGASEVCNLVDDNCVDGIDEGVCADLAIISSEYYWPASPVANDSIKFRVVVENIGNEPAIGVEWMMDTDSSDENTSQSGFDLDVGQSIIIYPQYEYELSGNYNPVFILDYNSQIIEVNELNNRVTIPVIIL